MAHILLVEDDPLVITTVVTALTKFHHIVETAETGASGIERLLHYHFDLAILDWELPGPQGIELLETYRKRGGRQPVLFLTGKLDVNDKVLAFDTGADDYLCKPFSYKELVARVAALLSRPPEDGSEVISSGGLELQLRDSTMSVDGQLVSLTAREFDLLLLLMKNPNHAYSAHHIIQKIYPSCPDNPTQAIRQLVVSLRKKMACYGSKIVTARGVGYLFASDE